MFRIFKTTIGIITATLVLLITGLSFVIFLATKSHPLTSGTVRVEGAEAELSVYRNQYGIPHIIAASDEDAFFGIGYAHAQDRLWQMDFLRRAGSGRLSEIFGRRSLEFDKFFRCFGIRRTAEKLYGHINQDSRMALDAYARGVNAYLADNRNRLPFEFDALRYEPEEWTGTDCLIISRLMAWQMSFSFWGDAIFGELAAGLGMEKARDLLPDYPATAPTVIPSKAPQTGDALSATESESPPIPPEAAASFAKLSEATQAARQMLGLRGSAIGSNSWVIRKRGKSTILANDPHLALSAPPPWYQAHISSPSLNVVGLTIPGLPFVIIGRNDDIAWGITNIMTDDCDLFYEQVDSANRRRYRGPDGSMRDFRYVRDTIVVKDSSTRLAVFDFRYTERSAVISDVHPFRDPTLLLKDSSTGKAAATAYFDKYCITYRWTGQSMSDDILAMYRLQKAQNWERFLRAVDGIGVPGLNFSYADTKGNIGIAPRGRVPKRGAGNPNFPDPGWLSEYAWQGEYEADKLPTVYNPKSGYVFSANNKISHNPPFFISSLWEPSSRAIRIDSLLQQFERYSHIEAGIMQMDVVSPHALALREYMRQAIAPNTELLDSLERSAWELLNNWDGAMEWRKSAPAIFNVFLERLVYNTFADELGDALYRKYTFVTSIATRRILELCAKPDADWFDLVDTPNREGRDAIIVHSFRQAVAYLKLRSQSTNIRTWKYGTIHTVTMPHPMGVQQPLDALVNIGPFEMGGNTTTINCAEWKYYDPYQVVVAASGRFVCDMQDSVVRTILPGGNSGQPLSAHYKNQVQLWRTGGFAILPVAARHDPSFNEHLRLVPRE